MEILSFPLSLYLSFAILYVNTLPVLLCHQEKKIKCFFYTCIRKEHKYGFLSLKILDNFLDANLDAQLIHDEIKIDSELEKVPDKDLECLLKDFLKYT